MVTVVYAPPIKLTIPQPSLISSTPHIVHPDLTCTWTKVGTPTGKGEWKLTIYIEYIHTYCCVSCDLQIKSHARELCHISAPSLKLLHVLSSVKHPLKYKVLCLLYSQSLLIANGYFSQPVSQSVGLGTGSTYV